MALPSQAELRQRDAQAKVQQRVNGLLAQAQEEQTYTSGIYYNQAGSTKKTTDTYTPRTVTQQGDRIIVSEYEIYKRSQSAGVSRNYAPYLKRQRTYDKSGNLIRDKSWTARKDDGGSQKVVQRYDYNYQSGRGTDYNAGSQRTPRRPETVTRMGREITKGGSEPEMITTTTSVYNVVKGGKTYQVADTPESVKWAEDKLGAVITPEAKQKAANEWQAEYAQAVRSEKVAAHFNTWDKNKEAILKEQERFYSHNPEQKTVNPQTFHTYSEYKGTNPSSFFGKIKSFAADFKEGGKQILLGTSSTDQYYLMDSGARPLGYNIGQGFTAVGGAVAGGQALKAGGAVISSAKAWTPISAVLSNKAGALAATLGTGIGTYEVGERIADYRTFSTSTTQEQALLTKYGKEARQIGLYAKEQSYTTLWRSGGTVKEKVVGTGAWIRDQAGGYAFTSNPLDRGAVYEYAAEQGLSQGEAASLYTAATKQQRGRGYAEMAAYAVASTTTELAGRFQAVKAFSSAPTFNTKVEAAKYIGRRVGWNSALLGAGEGSAFTYTYQGSRDMPQTGGYKVGRFTVPYIAVNTVAGAASAGMGGYWIARLGVTKPLASKGILGTAYTFDPFEAVGDFTAEGLTAGATRAGSIPVAGVAPKGTRFVVNAFTNTPTTTTTSTPSVNEEFSYPSNRRRWKFLSIVPTASAIPTFSPTPASIGTMTSTYSPTTSPSPVPVPTPATIPTLTPTTTPTSTTTTTTTSTPSTVPTITPTTTPSLTPTVTPVTTPTPQVPVAVPPPIGRSFPSFPKWKFRTLKRQAKRYTPSFYAVGLNIKGKAPSKKALKTGIALRPIIKAFSNGKRKTKRRSY